MIFTPETKGLTLEEMDGVFGDAYDTSEEERERQADISRRLETYLFSDDSQGS